MKLLVLLTIAMTVVSVMTVKGDWAKQALAEARKDMKIFGSGEFKLPKWSSLGSGLDLNNLPKGSGLYLDSLPKGSKKGDWSMESGVIRSDNRMSFNDGKKTSSNKTSMHQLKKSSKKGKTSCQKRSKSTKTKDGKEVSVQGGKDWEKCVEKK